MASQSSPSGEKPRASISSVVSPGCGPAQIAARVCQVMRAKGLRRLVGTSGCAAKDLLQAAAEDRQHRAALLVAGRIAAIDGQRQGLDAQGRRLGGRLADDLVDEPAQAVVVALRPAGRADGRRARADRRLRSSS